MQYRIKVVTYSDGVKEFIPQYRNLLGTLWLWTEYRTIAGYDHSTTVKFYSQFRCKEFLDDQIKLRQKITRTSVTYKSHPESKSPFSWW